MTSSMFGLLGSLARAGVSGAGMPTPDDLNNLGAQWAAMRAEQEKQTALLERIAAAADQQAAALRELVAQSRRG